MPGNRLMTAGAYYFPSIEAGKPFSFEIVSAFSGYAPSKFNGFFISSEVLQKLLLKEQEETEATSNDTSTRRFGMPTTKKSERHKNLPNPRQTPTRFTNPPMMQ